MSDKQISEQSKGKAMGEDPINSTDKITDRFYLVPEKMVDANNAPIFGPRQVQVFELAINSFSQKMIAERLGITIKTVDKMLHGQTSRDSDEDIPLKNPSDLGIYGVIEKLSGEKVSGLADFVRLSYKTGLVSTTPQPRKYE